MTGPPILPPAAPTATLLAEPLPASLIAAVVAAYPGPALWLEAGERIRATNAEAAALMAADPAWWAELVVWVNSLNGERGPPFSTRIRCQHTATVVEWVAAPFFGGHCLVFGHDATLERQLRQTLTESRQRFKDLVEISSDFAWEVGPEQRFSFVSPRGALGFAAEALIGRDPAALTGDPDTATDLPFFTRRQVDTTELWLNAADGDPVCLSVSAMPLFAASGEWAGARGVCRDITDQINRADELARVRIGERMLGHIGQTLRDRIDAAEALDEAAAETAQAIGATGCRIYRVTGIDAFSIASDITIGPKSDVSPIDFTAMVNALAAASGLLEFDRSSVRMLASRTQYRQIVNGALCVWRPANSSPWTDEDRALVTGVADRIGVAHAHLAYQDRLRRLSERDGLTGLFNRRTFFERLSDQLSRSERGTSVLFYIDLDNFKEVNDTHGHQQGDAVLKAVSSLISQSIRPGDLPGRLGGDEFVLWLSRADANGAAVVARRLLAGITSLRSLSASPDQPLGLSIGIAVYLPNSGETPQTLIDRADAAMYAAKARGKGTFVLAEPFGLKTTELQP